ncbi:tRNA pseudouridine(38-40) synthase TruA [Kordiimonas aquimaris]|uniref:tRNA pseudouridine(38-40) synthase TruA n=1 Tax=Kordiimonas aquimaris TaxID=707591 RepID=UPI0021CE0BD1|nr:tRNA pseudouridine(38-40) synthase TruA [Kordiimonas aquimaris]
MKRFKLTVEYDGRPYVGWQRQKNGASVQEALETAISKFVPEETVALTGSGRTDAGVHAYGQVAHFDTARDISSDEVQGAINYHIKPNPIAVVAVEEVDTDFNARFSAVRRHYVYKIINRRARLTFEAGLAWHIKPELDVSSMHTAAQHLVGCHDFTTFRHVHCQAQSPVKTMDYLRVEREGDSIFVYAGARSFLHHQIRSITGTLHLVGTGSWSTDDMKAALEAKDRNELGFNAPPDGLYFLKVDYPEG